MLLYLLIFLAGLCLGAVLVFIIAYVLSLRAATDRSKSVALSNAAKLRLVRKRIEQIISRSHVHSDAYIVAKKALKEINA